MEICYLVTGYYCQTALGSISWGFLFFSYFSKKLRDNE